VNRQALEEVFKGVHQTGQSSGSEPGDDADREGYEMSLPSGAARGVGRVSVKRSTSRKRLSKKEYEELSTFRYALRRFQKFSEEAAEAVGLTPRQHQALLAIKGFPGRERVTNGELAERLQVKHHSVVGLVNRLEAQGLIVREQGKSDRREFYVALTEQGAELLERLTAVHQRELRHLAPQLGTILERIRVN
jgi:DNA-binding MarR family transcriptional regulator